MQLDAIAPVDASGDAPGDAPEDAAEGTMEGAPTGTRYGTRQSERPWVPSDDDLIDYQRFVAARLEREPFDYLVVPGFVPAPIAIAAAEAFPNADLPGVLPAPDVPPDNAFGRLLTALRSRRLTGAFAAKFNRGLSTDRLMERCGRAHGRAMGGSIPTARPRSSPR